MDNAFDDWMNRRIAIVLEGDQITVQRTLQQIQMGGLYFIFDFEQIRSIVQSWLDLINILSTEDKRGIVNLFMRLWELEQVSGTGTPGGRGDLGSPRIFLKIQFLLP